MVDGNGQIEVALVDDDESLCRSLGRLLRAHDIGCRAFHSAESFLAEDAAHYDCLVLDIQLGGISGVELSERLAAAGSRVPVIFLTALDDPATKNRAIASACAGYFRKTEPGDQVVAAIQKAAASNP